MKDLASCLELRSAEIIKLLFKDHRLMLSPNSVLDAELVRVVAAGFGRVVAVVE